MPTLYGLLRGDAIVVADAVGVGIRNADAGSVGYVKTL
jgi:hypothetical protein